MKKIIFFIIIFSFYSISSFAGWLENTNQLIDKFQKRKSNNLSISEISQGLKEALKVGTENVVKKLGKKCGFFYDSKVHIPLPNNLQKIKNTLNKFGMGDQLNSLEFKLNRAAELATPKAKKLFWNAINQMTINDVKQIYNGGDDAATKYFKNKMSMPLKKEMRPIVEQTLNQVKAVRTYNEILNTYNSLPFVKPIKGNLTDYVLDKTLDAIFYYLAKEEASIRKNPAKRTTEILKKVFKNYKGK